MDPGLILISGFLVAILAYRAIFASRKKHRINPDPEPDAPDTPAEPARKRRASYGAARSRTRNNLK
ncbi:hypothetical protein FHY55_12025 [Oceanicola sp. D3]|uniref:hypothetical protein n=1 Tax=Oceanicola sp. D3 TaxID=2587163 RepID=UPI00112244DF|nr:hypothetical protein [Oceanicola sp. D3]QDC09926.1 hypothetical protein FHY55_12025 [Oceanicola sp. D3]